MKNETTVRTEIHYAQVGDYQRPCSPYRRPMIPNRWASMAGCGWSISRISVLCCTTGCC